MTQSRRTFNPSEWGRNYDAGERSAQSFVFAHGNALVAEISGSLFTKDMLLLEAGCGTGHLATKLAAGGARVFATDSDPAMLRFARERKTDEKFAGRIEFIAADALSLPVPDAACDGVIAVSLAGCLPDLKLFLKEAHRVLRPGGVVIITFTNRRSLILRANGFLNRLTARGRRDADSIAYHLYRLSEVRNMLREAGFDNVRPRFYNNFLSLGRWMFPPRRIALSLERLCPRPIGNRLSRNFLVFARKE